MLNGDRTEPSLRPEECHGPPEEARNSFHPCRRDTRLPLPCRNVLLHHLGDRRLLPDGLGLGVILPRRSEFCQSLGEERQCNHRVSGCPTLPGDHQRLPLPALGRILPEIAPGARGAVTPGAPVDARTGLLPLGHYCPPLNCGHFESLKSEPIVAHEMPRCALRD